MRKEYIYLVERKADGKKFVTYGNFKRPGMRPKYLFEFAPDSYSNRVLTPFGEVYNISCGIEYDSKKHHIIRQILKNSSISHTDQRCMQQNSPV